MKKRLFLIPTLILILVFAFSMTALANEGPEGLRVSGADAAWVYDGVSRTLGVTDDVILENTSQAPVEICIVVEGNNTVTLNGVNLESLKSGEGSDCVINFTQGGTLLVNEGTDNTLTNNAGWGSAISTLGDLVVMGKGQLDLQASYGGIFGANEVNPVSISITGGVSVNSEAVIYNPNGGINIENSTLKVSRDYQGISCNNGNLSISRNSEVNVGNGYVAVTGGDINIADSRLSVTGSPSEVGLVSVWASYSDEGKTVNGGNINISGASEVDVKAEDPLVVPQSASVSAADRDIYTIMYNGSIFGSESITFTGPVKVTADASELTSFDIPYNGILANKIAFNLDEEGFVLGKGTPEGEDDTHPAGLGIVAYEELEADPPANTSAAGDELITLAEKNVITQPKDGVIVSGNLVGSDKAALGTYQAVGVKDGDGTQIAEVQNPKTELNTDDHSAYVVGYGDGEFKEDNNLTRGECAAMLARLTEGFNENNTYECDFKDIGVNGKYPWYTNYVGFLQSNGIVKGYEDGTFGGDDPITRAEFTTMTVNYFKWEKSEDTITFTDVPKTYWAYEAINNAYVHGFIVGFGDDTFRPENDITRVHAVILLNRALGRNMPDENYIDTNIDNLITFSDVKKGTAAADIEEYYNILEAANGHDYTKDDSGRETWTGLIK
ncbi:MAG: S-layer homology domain-containing protein [Bacillota bacterium]|nr:S-layer homology domain-containing protein [Bacillota bacterium]